MTPLWKMYVGQQTPSQITQLGRFEAAVSSLSAERRRRRLLEEALRTGRIQASQLSKADATLVGGTAKLDYVRAMGNRWGGGPLKSVGRFFGNLLGERGLYGMATHLPGGIAEMGRAAWYDALHREPGGRMLPGEQSQLQEKVVKPTIKGFKEDAVALGELAAGRPTKFVEAPLNPILDVGSIFSGGATLAGKGGGALARASALRTGEASGTTLGSLGMRLSKITSTEGRSPTITGIPRMYSSSPTLKAGQVGWDRLVTSDLGRKLNMPAAQERLAMNRLIDVGFGESTQIGAHNVGQFSRPVARALQVMNPQERAAVTYSLMGVNTPELAAAFRARLEDSLRRAEQAALGHDVEGPHIGEFARDLVDPASARIQLHYLNDPAVIGLITRPTDAMRGFASVWDSYVRSRHGVLGIDAGLHEGHISELQRSLTEDLPPNHPLWDSAGPYTPEGGISPSYVPARAARDFALQEPSRFDILGRPYFGRNKLDSTTRILGRLRPTDPLRNPVRPYMHESSLDTVLSGAARVDPKVYLEHIRSVEEDVVRQTFNSEMLDRVGFKTDEGLKPFTSADQMNTVLSDRMREARAWGDPNWRQWDPRNWVLVHPELTRRWQQSANRAVQDTMDIVLRTHSHLERLSAELADAITNHDWATVESIKEHLDKITDPNLDEAYGSLADTLYGELDSVSKEDWAGVQDVRDEIQEIIHNAPEEALRETAKEFWAHLGADVSSQGSYAIPRQAFERLKANLNVTRPYNNRIGNAYASLLNTWRTMTLAYMPRWLVNTAVGSAFMSLIKGNVNPRHYAQAARLTRADSLPARVRLGGVVHGEALEPGNTLARALPVTRGSFHAVQSVEDFFRSSSFVQSLEKAAKQQMAETGRIIDHYRPFWNSDRNAYIDQLIRDHPDLVEKAIADVDKFAYNFTSLTPNERRYVRLAVPFWGWYKFISKFAYRLPVEFPGRTRAMSAVSAIGQQIESELGPIPSWVRGSIILGKDKDGTLRYLPTLGLNPMSQFLDPFGGEGKVGGILRLGQLNPAIQAALSGMGVNPLDAGQVAIGPQEGIGPDYIGRLTSAVSGESTTAMQHGGLRRFLHTLATSIPQVRIGELAMTGGKPVYPESIPIFDERPMPVQPESRRNVEPLGILNQYFGSQPRTYNLEKYQKQLPKRAEYVRRRLKRERRLAARRE
jgi:hypothetical protein